MKYINSVVLLLYLLMANNFLHGSCDWPGGFFKLTKEKGAIVIKCAVKEYTNYTPPRTPELEEYLWENYKVELPEDYIPRPDSIVVSVDEVIVGELSEKVIVIQCNGTRVCEPEVSTFTVGSHWVMIVKERKSNASSEVQNGTIYKLGSGEYYLRDEGDQYIAVEIGPDQTEPTVVTEDELQQLRQIEQVAGGDRAR